MTALELDYWRLQEAKRHNLADESAQSKSAEGAYLRGAGAQKQADIAEQELAMQLEKFPKELKLLTAKANLTEDQAAAESMRIWNQAMSSVYDFFRSQGPMQMGSDAMHSILGPLSEIASVVGQITGGASSGAKTATAIKSLLS